MHNATERRRLPKYKRDPERFGRFDLTPRDLAILRLVLDYRYLTVDHIQALVPGSPRQIARRLQGLFHHGLVARLLPPLRVREAGKDWQGSPKVTYAIDAAGVETICEADGRAPKDLPWDPRHKQRMQWFLEHKLGVSTFRATLVRAVAGRTDIELDRWLDEEELRRSVTVQYPGGREHEHRVAPDAYFAARHQGELRNFFVEFDRGTEDHPRLLKKFQALWWYFSEGSPYFEEYPNAKNRLVLIVAPSEVRLERMRDTLRKVDARGRGLRQFWFATEGDYRLADPATLLRPIWRVGVARNDDERAERRALFEADDE